MKKLKKIILAFFISLSIPVLFVLYVGLILSAIISILAGLFRTIGFEQIEMSIWNGMELPVSLSIPLSLIVSSLLIIVSVYIKRSIKFCVSHLKF